MIKRALGHLLLGYSLLLSEIVAVAKAALLLEVRLGFLLLLWLVDDAKLVILESAKR